MLDTVFGLPVHPLVVHATVVVVPSAALAVVLATLWPRFRAWAGWLPVALSVAAVVLTPISTSSGESLEHRKPHTALIEKHAHLAGLLIWWVVPLALVAAAQWWFGRRGTPGTGLRIGVGVAAVVVAAGTLVQVTLIGHSGAESAWSNVGAARTR
ncbi:MAG: hypothetical protein JWO46_1916 [Nocardioidaceae bacterium]|nr:hypothetical protein [Nocardioidaceae bacterium]